MRCVFDTNAAISALLLDDSIPERALFAALRQGQILLSDDTLAELRQVLGRPKFARYTLADERERFLETLLEAAAVLLIDEKIQACRDPSDDKFLELAVAGNADFIVTGDDDLLRMHPFRGIAIVTPAQLLHQLTGQS